MLSFASARSRPRGHSQRRCAWSSASEIAPSLLAFLRRAVKTAESNEASAIVFEMNTYGGRLDAASDIVNALNQRKFPHTRLSTPTRAQPARLSPLLRNIFYAPVSAIGAAAPILRRAKIFPAHQRRRRFRIGLRLSAGRQSKTGIIRMSRKRS